jgi:hypothetical protein
MEVRRGVMEVRRLSIHGDRSQRRRRPGRDVSFAVATAARVRSFFFAAQRGFVPGRLRSWIRYGGHGVKGPGAKTSLHVQIHVLLAKI